MTTRTDKNSRPITLPLRRDGLYWTRGGELRRVLCTDFYARHPVVLATLDSGFLFTARDDGGFCSRKEDICGGDLVAEYVEPSKPREFWVREDLCEEHPKDDPRDRLARWIHVREVLEDDR
jgi:hypothetical protein